MSDLLSLVLCEEEAEISGSVQSVEESLIKSKIFRDLEDVRAILPFVGLFLDTQDALKEI